MFQPSWIVTLEEDTNTGEIILPLPIDMTTQLGWEEGTEICWVNNKNGTYTLMKKE